MKNAYNVLILSVLAPAVGLMAVACGGDDSKPTTDSTGTGGNVTYELLDDMEAPTMGAGSYGILSNGSRVGGWFIYDDGTIPAGMPGAMMFDEIALTPAHATFNGTSSTRAIHTSGGPFTGYGSGFGTNLNGDTRGLRSHPLQGDLVLGQVGVGHRARQAHRSLRQQIHRSPRHALRQGQDRSELRRQDEVR